jgi:hypothetical protein
MRWLVLSCALAGCIGDDPPRFADKGQGVWVDGPEAPAVTYRAVWGAHARDVFAVGDGAAHFDGVTWSSYALPAATYRAIWGRSADEIWIGGDNILLARTFTGWQAMQVFDGDLEITEYSVLAIDGDYAVIRTGAQLLLVINQGSAWETVYWRAGSSLPFSTHPSLQAGSFGAVLGSDNGLYDLRTTNDLGVPFYEALPFFYDEADGTTVVGGFHDELVAAGPDRVMFQFQRDQPIAVFDDRTRSPHGVSIDDGRAFVVGERIDLGLRSTRTVTASPIEACDVDGCALERIAEDREQALQAVWSNATSAVAVGDGWIVHRTACGSLSCQVD